MYVYLLSTHDDDGAHDVAATLDRTKVASLMETRFPGRDEDPAQEAETLAALLGRPDHELASERRGHQVSDGWGGIRLNVAELS